MKHYLQVTDEHFKKAVDNGVHNRVHNRVQKVHADSCKELNDEFSWVDLDLQKKGFYNHLQELALSCNNPSMGPVGFEPTTNGL